MTDSFRFYTECHLVRLLGRKAKNAPELLEGIRSAPASSLYYHTHRFLQQHHYLSPEPPNDFAYWLANILNLKELGEAFASVDTVGFKDLEELRAEFLRISEDFLAAPAVVPRSCPEGQEFQFMACKTFVLPLPYVTHDLNEFAHIIANVSVNSLYFHVFEARLRLGKNDNDFSAWFKGLGEHELAAEVATLDPYSMTLDGLRQKIIRAVRKYAKH